MTVLLNGWCRKWQPLGVLQWKIVLPDSRNVPLTLFCCFGLMKCYNSLCIQFARRAGRLAWWSVLAAPDLVITIIPITRMELTNLVFNCLNKLSWKWWLLNIRQIKQMVLEGLWKMGWSCHSSAAISVAWRVQRCVTWHFLQFVKKSTVLSFLDSESWLLSRAEEQLDIGLIPAFLVSCHICSSLNPVIKSLTSLLAFCIPWSHPLDIIITINHPHFSIQKTALCRNVGVQ